MQDGTTSLAFVTPVDGAAGERAVTLGQLIGRVKNGASALQGFKEDRRNGAKAFNPIYYGAFREDVNLKIFFFLFNNFFGYF